MKKKGKKEKKGKNKKKKKKKKTEFCSVWNQPDYLSHVLC